MAIVVDAVVFLTPTIAVGAGITTLYAKVTRRQGREIGKWSPPKPARHWWLAFSGLSIAVEIRKGNWRSPGYRALGLGRVDARTGGPVSIQSALVRSATRLTLSKATPRLWRQWPERRHERLMDAHAELEELRRAHADDREAVEQGIRDINERHHVNPATGCLAPLVPLLLVDLWAVFSPLHQTLYERLAGTVVVEG